MQVPYFIDLAGTFVFAISGALAASDKKMYRDIFGVSFTAFITAVGGGTVRDITLGVHPLSWVKDGNYLVVIFSGVIISILFGRGIRRLRKTFFVFDTIGIALYTILGVQKSLALGVNPMAAVILGMFSAVFGGVIRDTLINEIPLIFRKEIYATACLAGAFLFIILHRYQVSADVNFFSSILLIVMIRIVAVRYQLTLPKIEN